MSEELKAFWDLTKKHLSREGLFAVAKQYPELKEEVEGINQRRAALEHMLLVTRLAQISYRR